MESYHVLSSNQYFSLPATINETQRRTLVSAYTYDPILENHTFPFYSYNEALSGYLDCVKKLCDDVLKHSNDRYSDQT